MKDNLLKMKSLFVTDNVQEIKDRLAVLGPDTRPLWGKMNSAQMLAHCCEPLLLVLEGTKLKKPPLLTRWILQLYKPLLYNDKPWKQNLPTAPEYKIVSPREYEQEYDRLLGLIEKFHQEKNRSAWPDHPIFGYFEPEQWGKMQYKHLDHHLRQFGL